MAMHHATACTATRAAHETDSTTALTRRFPRVAQDSHDLAASWTVAGERGLRLARTRIARASLPLLVEGTLDHDGILVLVLLAVGGQRASVAANARHGGLVLEGADAEHDQRLLAAALEIVVDAARQHDPLIAAQHGLGAGLVVELGLTLQDYEAVVLGGVRVQHVFAAVGVGLHPDAHDVRL